MLAMTRSYKAVPGLLIEKLKFKSHSPFGIWYCQKGVIINEVILRGNVSRSRVQDQANGAGMLRRVSEEDATAGVQRPLRKLLMIL